MRYGTPNFPKPVTITLTPRQAQFLLLDLQSCLDVSEDKTVRQWARQLIAKLGPIDTRKAQE